MTVLDVYACQGNESFNVGPCG